MALGEINFTLMEYRTNVHYYFVVYLRILEFIDLHTQVVIIMEVSLVNEITINGTVERY